MIALLAKRVAAVEIRGRHDARLVAAGLDDDRAGRDQGRGRRVLVETGRALLRVLRHGLGLLLRLRLLLRSLLLRGRAALLLRLRRGLLALRRVMPALLLLLCPRRRLCEGRSRLEQINCRERRTANDEPHSRFHVRLCQVDRRFRRRTYPVPASGL